MISMKRTYIIFAIIVLIFTMFSCNLPGSVPPLSVDDQAATINAATLTAEVRGGTATVGTNTSPQAVSSTPTRVPNSGTATITPTFSTPMLRVIEQTNCRTGPGQDYEVVFTYLPNADLV